MTPLPEKMAFRLQLPPHLNTGVRTKLPSGLCMPGEAWHAGSLRLRGGSYHKPAPLPLTPLWPHSPVSPREQWTHTGSSTTYVSVSSPVKGRPTTYHIHCQNPSTGLTPGRNMSVFPFLQYFHGCGYEAIHHTYETTHTPMSRARPQIA